MFALFKSIFKGRDSVDSHASLKMKHELYGLDNLDDDSIGYPPNPQGIPVVQPRVLRERLEPEIQFIRVELGLTTSEFDTYVLPVMENLIAYADLLPASEYMHHSTGGGLIAHSFDVAKRAMRSAQHTHFPVGSGYLSDTQRSNIQWKTATVLSALLHDGGKILADVEVTNGDDANLLVWDAHSEDMIHEWAAMNNIDRYFIRWREQRHQKHQNASLMVMQRLIPQLTWSWIDSCFDGKQIHSAMLAAIASADLAHPVSKIVAEADSASGREDMLTRNSHITKEVKRVPLSQILADLMRHYILTNKWTVNCKDAPVWFVNDELYVVWGTAIPDLLEDMNAMGYMIPKVPEVLARTMIEEGMAVADGDEPLFAIYPEILGDDKKPVKLSVLKIRSVERLVIEQHKLYSIKEHQSKRKSQPVPVIEVPPEELKVPEITHSVTHQKRFESSLDTVGRVLGNMSLAQRETWEQQTDVQPAPQEENNAAPPIPNEPDQVEQPLFNCDVANYIKERFDFDVANGAIQLPVKEINAVIKSMVSSDCETWNPRTAKLAIHSSTEIVVNE
ncbi:MobH family relaxase [Vibrio breoganii]